MALDLKKAPEKENTNTDRLVSVLDTEKGKKDAIAKLGLELKKVNNLYKGRDGQFEFDNAGSNKIQFDEDFNMEEANLIDEDLKNNSELLKLGKEAGKSAETIVNDLNSLRKKTIEAKETLEKNAKLVSELISKCKIPEGYKVVPIDGKVKIMLGEKLVVRTMDPKDPKNTHYLTENSFNGWVKDRIGGFEIKKPALALALKGEVLNQKNMALNNNNKKTVMAGETNKTV